MNFCFPLAANVVRQDFALFLRVEIVGSSGGFSTRSPDNFFEVAVKGTALPIGLQVMVGMWLRMGMENGMGIGMDLGMVFGMGVGLLKLLDVCSWDVVPDVDVGVERNVSG